LRRIWNPLRDACGLTPNNDPATGLGQDAMEALGDLIPCMKGNAMEGKFDTAEAMEHNSTQCSPHATLGAYHLTPELLAFLPTHGERDDVPLKDEELPESLHDSFPAIKRLPGAGKDGATIFSTMESAGSPAYGDVKIEFFKDLNAGDEVSVIAEEGPEAARYTHVDQQPQKGAAEEAGEALLKDERTIEEGSVGISLHRREVRGCGVVTPNVQLGQPFCASEKGESTAKAMYGHAKADEGIVTWIIRGVGLFFLVLGFYLLLNPIVLFVSWIPFVGGIVQLAAFVAALVAGTGCCLVVTMLFHLAFRPLHVLLLGSLIGGGIGIYLTMVPKGTRPAA